MTFRSVTIEDAELLLSWRNDPLTRQNSITQGEIVLSDHLSWLQSKLDDSSISIYMAFDENEPIGMIRICQISRQDSLFSEIQELSWVVAPKHRGRGMGKKMLQTFRLSLKGVVQAQIKKKNNPSKKLAASIGLCFVKEENGVEVWEGEF